MALSKVTLDFEEKTVSFADKISASIIQHKNLDLNKLLMELYLKTFFDTGLLFLGENQSGPLVIRGNWNNLTVAFQCAPGLYPTIWGKREHDESAKTYDLAFPYKLI